MLSLNPCALPSIVLRFPFLQSRHCAAKHPLGLFSNSSVIFHLLQIEQDLQPSITGERFLPMILKIW
jgi:hypothetical protein